jgi:hypothetical protein
MSAYASGIDFSQWPGLKKPSQVVIGKPSITGSLGSFVSRFRVAFLF